jgi:hypothetical protein
MEQELVSICSCLVSRTRARVRVATANRNTTVCSKSLNRNTVVDRIY